MEDATKREFAKMIIAEGDRLRKVRGPTRKEDVATLIAFISDNFPETEDPDAKVWEEITELTDRIDDCEESWDHYVFSNNGKQFGAARVERSMRNVDGGGHSLAGIRDELRKIAKEKPTLESETAARKEAEGNLATAESTINRLRELLVDADAKR